MRKAVVVALLAALLVCAMPFLAQADSAIPAVSASQLSARLQGAGDRIYGLASPLVDTLAKLMLALAGIMLLLVLVFGVRILWRAFGICFAVGCGLLLFYSAPYIVEGIKALCAW